MPITGTVVSELAPAPQVSRKPASTKMTAKAEIPPEKPVAAITTNKPATKIIQPKKAEPVKPGIIRDDSDLK